MNGQLHKKLHINRGADEITAWNYIEGKRVVYSYTDVKRLKQTAFTTRQVCAMIGRSRQQVEEAITSGNTTRPQFSYTLDEHRRIFQYLWREEDIMDVHRYFSGVHRGRPRKDGRITPQHLPTPRELRAMIRQEQILYVQDGDNFIPTWAAPDI